MHVLHVQLCTVNWVYSLRCTVHASPQSITWSTVYGPPSLNALACGPYVFPSRGRSTAAAPGLHPCLHISVTLRIALRPDAARIPRKQMIKFLKPSRRGPGPGCRGTADGYSLDIARTSTLRLRLRLCHKYNNLKSSIQMYIMSTNAEYAEMTIAKLLVQASARSQRCLERILHELKSIY